MDELISHEQSVWENEQVDYSDAWSEQDVRDLAAYSLRLAEVRYPEEDTLHGAGTRKRLVERCKSALDISF